MKLSQILTVLCSLLPVTADAGIYFMRINGSGDRASFVELPLPEGATLVSASSGGSLDPVNRSIKWGPLAPGVTMVSFHLKNEMSGQTLIPVVEPAAASAQTNGLTISDADGDGLDDDYEASSGITEPSADSDKDGTTDLSEVLLGTDPNDPHSRLRTIELSGTGDEIQWTLAPQLADVPFVLEAAESLESDDWLQVQVDVMHDVGQSTLVFADKGDGHSEKPQRFFRLRFGVR